MKIIETVSSTEILYSGITYCVNELSQGLSVLGENMEILSLSSISKNWVSSMNEYKFRNDFLKIPLLHKSGYSSDMKKYILASNSNIVHTHGLWMFPNIYRNTNAKFVTSPHGMLAKNALKFSPIKKKIFYSLFQKKALADARLFFASVESVFDDIRNFGLNAPIAIIPHGVNIPNIKKEKKFKNQKTVISLGRLHPKKGLDTLIKAWSRIEPIFSKWHLKIVCPDECGYQLELEKLIKKLNLNRVTIEPPIYGPERDLLLSRCDLFVLPSKTENFAMTVAESLAFELPVIATKATPWSGLKTNQCGWWIKGDEVSLFEKLKVALSLPEKQLIDMGRRGKKWMQKDFSWENASQKTLEAYQWIENKSKMPEHICT